MWTDGRTRLDRYKAIVRGLHEFGLRYVAKYLTLRSSLSERFILCSGISSGSVVTSQSLRSSHLVGLYDLLRRHWLVRSSSPFCVLVFITYEATHGWAG